MLLIHNIVKVFYIKINFNERFCNYFPLEKMNKVDALMWLNIYKLKNLFFLSK